MNDFDTRWGRFAAHARRAPARPAVVPPGFATRVLARRGPGGEAGLEAVWERLALRWLAGVAAVLAVCAAVELPASQPAAVFDPALGNTIGQVVWRL